MTINPPKPPSGGKYQIQLPRPGYDLVHPIFSFRYCQPDHHQYRVKDKCKFDDLHHFLTHLKTMSALKWRDIENNQSMFHMHPVPKKHSVAAPEGFGLVQFKAFKEARVIGYFNKENVFEVIIFDRKHEFCPSDKF